MFIVFPLEARLEQSPPEWLAAWRAGIVEARRLAAAADDHWMFHGTSLTRARAIMEEGFRYVTAPDIPPERTFVYWGPLDMATSFADKGSYRDRPALLAAPLRLVTASGDPLPMTSEDRQCEGELELADWRASLAESGALRVRGGCRVQGMVLLGA